MARPRNPPTHLHRGSSSSSSTTNARPPRRVWRTRYQSRSPSRNRSPSHNSSRNPSSRSSGRGRSRIISRKRSCEQILWTKCCLSVSSLAFFFLSYFFLSFLVYSDLLTICRCDLELCLSVLFFSFDFSSTRTSTASDVYVRMYVFGDRAYLVFHFFCLSLSLMLARI